MRRSGSRHGKRRLDTGIVHDDVAGKALVLIMVLSLALVSMNFSRRTVPRVVGPGQNVVEALDEGSSGVKMLPAVPAQGDVRVLGLDYEVPHQRKADMTAGALRVRLDAARDSGRLRGYSVPPRRLAFEPGGGAIILPTSPLPAAPRNPVLVSHGTRTRKKVALTFDTSEVAEPKATKALFEELARLRVPATIFVCGAWCYSNPDLLRTAVSLGFEIGNHSSTHPDCTKFPNEVITSEIKGTEKAIKDISGVSGAAYFRPPYGATDARVEQVAADCGYATVLWSVDTLDWEPSTIREQIRDRATVGTRGGDIILMHSLGKYTRDALVEVVNNLRSGGFELTTLTGVMEP